MNDKPIEPTEDEKRQIDEIYGEGATVRDVIKQSAKLRNKIGESGYIAYGMDDDIAYSLGDESPNNPFNDYALLVHISSLTYERKKSGMSPLLTRERVSLENMLSDRPLTIFNHTKFDALHASTALTPARDIFVHGKIGQNLLSMSKNALRDAQARPIRVVLRQPGKSLQDHISERETPIINELEHAFGSISNIPPEVYNNHIASARSAFFQELLGEDGKALTDLFKETAFLGWCGARDVDPHQGNIIYDPDSPALSLIDQRDFPMNNDVPTRDRYSRMKSALGRLRHELTSPPLMERTFFSDPEFQQTATAFKVALDDITNKIDKEYDTFFKHLTQHPPEEEKPLKWDDLLRDTPAFKKVEKIDAITLETSAYTLLETLKRVESNIQQSPVRGV